MTRERGLPASVRVLVGVGAVLFWVVQLTLLLWAGLPLPDTILLAVLLVAMPAFALAQLPLVGDTAIERLPAYWGSITTLWLIGTACWLVGTRVGGAAAIGAVWIPAGPLVGWSIGLTLAGLAVMLVFRQVAVATGVRESPMLRALLPRTSEERGVFALLSVAAGVAEELAYRGYAISVLAAITGVPGAAVLTSVVFGILHGYQGLLGTVRTTSMGGILAWGFLASGSLLPVIVAHTLIDLLAGLLLGERLLPPEEPSPAEAALTPSPTRES
ncbi:MAG TPA: type II CAAX endopeptidase family protein [Longimicrobiales bacterium]|nr:type II CAAX endopeptidase family protein [Longimicrobiales bacterium]